MKRYLLFLLLGLGYFNSPMLAGAIGEELLPTARVQDDGYSVDFVRSFSAFNLPDFLLGASFFSFSPRGQVAYDRDGDRNETTYRAADVGTLANPFDVRLFGNVSLFPGIGGAITSKTTTPLLALDATAILWSSSGGSAWLTGSNWTGGNVPSATQIAEFGANPSGTTGVGINMNNPTNNGTSNQAVGAIYVDSNRAAALLIGDSSTSVSGTLTLNGVTVNSVNNVILRNNSNQSLTIQNIQGSAGARTMDIALGNATENVVSVDSTGNIIISSNITGAGKVLSVNTSNSGDLRLSGTNTYSGGTNISGGPSGGRLRIDTTTALPTTGTVAITTGGRLTLNIAGTFGGTSQALTFNPNQTTNPSLDINSGAAVIWQGTVAINADTRIEPSGSAGSLTFSGNVSGSGTLIKQAAGNLILSGTANTASGGTQIGNGTITVNSGSKLGTGDLLLAQTGTNATTVTFNNATQSVGSLSSTWAATTGTIDQRINLNGTALSISQTTDGTFGSGAVSTLTSTLAGSGSITKDGAAILTLSSANSYTGGTTITLGTLRMSGAGTMGSTSGTLTANGGFLDLNGTNQAVGALNGTNGTIYNSASSSSNTLTIGTGNASGSFSGTITDHDPGGSGFVKLVKTGTGTETLAGTSNYTGGTEINGGTLQIASTGSVQFGGGNDAITFTGSSTLVNNGTINQTGTGRGILENTGGLTLSVTNGSATNSAALIKTADADAIRVSQGSTNITLDNYGSIISLNASAGGSQAIDWNSITTGGNTLNNYSTGLVKAFEADAVRPGVNGVITNSGTILSITNTGSGSDGIDAQTNSGVSITNSGSGSIEGGRHGITGGNTTGSGAYTMSVTNNVGATIKGDNGSGINIDGINGNEVVTVVNHGTIIGDGAGDGVDVDGLVNLTNTGLIRSANAFSSMSGGTGHSEGISVGGGTIINSGTIEGLVAPGNTLAVGIGASILGNTIETGPLAGTREAIYGNVVLTNQAGGLIRGDTSFGIFVGGPASGFTVTINNNAGATVRTGSATDAAIQTGADNDTINNAGLIDGSSSGKAIDLAAGNDTLNITGGSASILGDVSGGTGTNALTIDPGSGNVFSYAGSFSNFNTVETKSGTVTLTGSSTYTGTTLISGGTLELKNTGGVALSGTSGVQVNNTGTLLFSANNQLNQTTPPGITVNGGKIDAGGVSQGTGGTPATPNSGSIGLGALTMNASSIIDLTGTSVLHFANSSAQTWTGTLSVWDWSGTPTTGGGAEQILFGGDATGLTAGQLLQVNFYSDGGSTLISNTALILGDGEIIPGPMAPVPEPSTWAAAALALGAVGFVARRKFRRA